MSTVRMATGGPGRARSPLLGWRGYSRQRNAAVPASATKGTPWNQFLPFRSGSSCSSGGPSRCCPGRGCLPWSAPALRTSAAARARLNASSTPPAREIPRRTGWLSRSRPARRPGSDRHYWTSGRRDRPQTALGCQSPPDSTSFPARRRRSRHGSIASRSVSIRSLARSTGMRRRLARSCGEPGLILPTKPRPKMRAATPLWSDCGRICWPR